MAAEIAARVRIAVGVRHVLRTTTDRELDVLRVIESERADQRQPSCRQPREIGLDAASTRLGGVDDRDHDVSGTRGDHLKVLEVHPEERDVEASRSVEKRGLRVERQKTLSLIYTPSAVPEPSSIFLVGVATAAVGGWAGRRRLKLGL